MEKEKEIIELNYKCKEIENQYKEQIDLLIYEKNFLEEKFNHQENSNQMQQLLEEIKLLQV